MTKRNNGPRCPLRGGKPCNGACMWLVGESCAVAVLAEQAARQANEQYSIVEIMNGGAAQPAQAEAAEAQEEGGEP